MVIKTSKGMFKIIKNYRDAFNETAFIEKYIEECMDKYPFIVGDISSSILRLKGFDKDPKSKSYYGFIDDYLENSCAFGCPFYVLKRIKHENEAKHKDDNIVTIQEFVINPIVKENFDKESLVLKSTPKGKVNIVLDLKKINAIPVGTLSPDLAEIVRQEKTQNTNNVKPLQQVKEEEVVNTYVSASPDFDPTKVKQNKKPKNKTNSNQNNNNQNNNQNNNNQNNNQNNNNHRNKKHNKKK